MSNTASLKKEYQDRIVPALTKEFGYKTVMQVPVLKKIVINQGLGMAAADKKIIDIYFRENDLFLNSEGIITSSVQLTFDPLKVTNTRKSYANKSFQKFIHLFTA